MLFHMYRPMPMPVPVAAVWLSRRTDDVHAAAAADEDDDGGDAQRPETRDL